MDSGQNREPIPVLDPSGVGLLWIDVATPHGQELAGAMEVESGLPKVRAYSGGGHLTLDVIIFVM